MKYILFEKSAVENLINDTALQSLEFPLSKNFISSIRTGAPINIIEGVWSINDKQGLIFCGKKSSKTFLFIDLEQCKLLEKASDNELLIVLQKTFRFSVRFWNRQSFTSCEKIFKDKTVIFPFPYSTSSSFRLVIERNPKDKRLETRGINNSLLAYKYGTEGAPSGAEETPDVTNFRKAGESYLSLIPDFKEMIKEKTLLKDTSSTNTGAIHFIKTDAESSYINASKTEFKYLDYEKQLSGLTDRQKDIVYCKDISSPIRIEGPAGTGKSIALVLRTIHLLKEAKETGSPLYICFITHSKSSELSIRQYIRRLGEEEWLINTESPQYLILQTLQEYCMHFISISETQVIDLDATEAKQLQLYFIQEAYDQTRGRIYNTYKSLFSNECLDFFEKAETNKIVLMLQYEFSVRIKGAAQGDLDLYKNLDSLNNGLPLNNDADKEYVYNIYSRYQKSLEIQSVYDTDDIILEALARLNAPLWRRARANQGADYLIVDEMHLFNLNEQQVFHYLTKDVEQKKIPICFALDYGQAIGERGRSDNLYIENTLSNGKALYEELSTVFRSSPQIAELCASITSTGALIFDAFINPYKYCESGFTAREEELCKVPSLVMYDSDAEMKNSLPTHIKSLVNKYKCSLCEIAIIFFDEEMLIKEFTECIGKYSVSFINGKYEAYSESANNKVICSLPEYVNGLEYKCVILVGVDEGRVPQTSVKDISANFLKYNALNKLYLACSRARFSITILGSNARGISNCLNHSLANGTLEQVSPEDFFK